MEILSAIIQLLGGLAMFLYGIEVMGDGLKNSSGAALKRIFLLTAKPAFRKYFPNQSRNQSTAPVANRGGAF